MKLSVVGLALFLWRFKPWRKEKGLAVVDAKVSIIIPCRNEENNIARLLPTLKNFNQEIIVVDDSSIDRTREVAAQFSFVKVVDAGPKPEGWAGKNWACHQGFLNSDSPFLLFTDADTLHLPHSLNTALSFLNQQKADLVSAPPYHRCEVGFEKLSGLFHLMLLLTTAYLKRPTFDRLFVIGQYILVKRSSYLEVGGHKAIAHNLVDDIELGRLFIKNNKKIALYPFATLYQVQMFLNLKEFVNGWIRLFRLGLPYSSLIIFCEVFLIVRLFLNPDGFLVYAMIALFVIQKQHGNFSPLGIVFAPLNMVFFAVLSLVALFQTALGLPILWRSRSYPKGNIS